ncbi:MAG: N-acetylglucosamine-6-phosphate deacetylase [Traorella sp.]
MLVHSKRIYVPDGCIDATLHIEDGKIVDIIYENGPVDLELGDLRVIPGIIDTHNHGTMGYSLGFGSDGDMEKNVRGYLKGLAAQGVTACLPTASVEYFSTIADVMDTEIDGAMPLGIHSEGPYLNRVGEKGVDTGHPNIDLDYIKKMIELGKGKLKLVALAPELEGAKEAIEYFTSHNIRCAFAHSNMMYHEALEAFKWGISVTTHTANVMSGIHHRNMGGLGACLLNDDVYNEMICDGMHVSNEMLTLMMRVKNNALEKIMMVSDCTPASGAPVGHYRFGGMDVYIDERGFCLTDTGRLMGSTMPVIGGIKNLYQNLGFDLNDIIKMSSQNPAKVYEATTKGSLEIGKDADFVVLNDDFEVLQTYREGHCIYNHEIDKHLFNEAFLNQTKVE